jgi:hypothetical protein
LGTPILEAVATLLKAAGSCDTRGTTSAPSGDRGNTSVAAADATLEIIDLRFCRRVLGLGSFDAYEAPAFAPGQSVIMYCEMAGVRYEPRGNGFHSRLQADVEIARGNAEPPIWRQSLGPADETCRRCRRDYYVNYRLTIPEHLPKGSYVFRLMQKDALADRKATKATSITIR